MHKCVTWSIREINACGTFTVPEDRRVVPLGRQIALRIVVLRARGRPTATDPVVFLTGGPGFGAADEVSLAARALVDVRATRDVVLIDQRGTGQSSPLNCNLYNDGNRLQPYVGTSYPTKQLRACRALLEKHADLTRYTTAIAADDLAETLSALGYSRVNLFGVSYGSRLALMFMRRYPDRVRSAVLSGVAPPDLVIPVAAARAGAHALVAAFASCSADPDCHARMPEPATDFRVVEQGLSRSPARVVLWNWRRLDQEAVSITQRAFNEQAWSMLYDPGRARRLLGYVHQAALNDWAAFADAAVTQRRGHEDAHSDGLLLSVLCTEDAPRLATRDTVANSAPLGLPMVRELLAACASWPRGLLATEDTVPVVSDAPVLLLSGALDPITPPDWADSAAATLPNNVRFVDPDAGHAHLDGCTSSAIGEFIRTDGHGSLTLPCLATWKRAP